MSSLRHLSPSLAGLATMYLTGSSSDFASSFVSPSQSQSSGIIETNSTLQRRDRVGFTPTSLLSLRTCNSILTCYT